MPKAYATTAEADQWFNERHLTHWGQYSKTLRKAVLLRASEWIDNGFTFVGQPETPGQDRAWPRMNAFLDNGFAIAGVPDAVIEAVYILAEALLEDEQSAEETLGLGPRVLGQKVAGVEIRYDHDGSDETRIQRLLAPYLKKPTAHRQIRRS